MSKPPRSDAQRADRLAGQGRSPLARLLEHAREVARIDQVVRRSLEPDLADHVQVAEFRQGRLVVVCTSAAWATRWRMRQAEIVGRLRESARLEVRAVDVRISPIRRDTVPPRRRKALPEAARDALRRFAQDSGDAEIRALVERSAPDVDGE